MWERVNNGLELPNTVSENVQWDTAMAVAWLYDDVHPGKSADFTYVASFAMPDPPIEPPIETTPPTQPQPEPPIPGTQPPEPEDPASVVIDDPVFVTAPGDSADVIAGCRTEPGGSCSVEAARGLVRRAAEVLSGHEAHLPFPPSPSQRRELRRDCATELNVRVAVYQPPGHRARTSRRAIGVCCASLRGRCGTAASSAFTALPRASALVLRGRPPSARVAC